MSEQERLLQAVLDDPEIRIWARRLEAAEELAGEVGATVSPSIDAALFGAEVVCTTTASVKPIIEKRWLARTWPHPEPAGTGKPCACSRQHVRAPSWPVPKRSGN